MNGLKFAGKKFLLATVEANTSVTATIIGGSTTLATADILRNQLRYEIFKKYISKEQIERRVCQLTFLTLIGRYMFPWRRQEYCTS